MGKAHLLACTQQGLHAVGGRTMHGPILQGRSKDSASGTMVVPAFPRRDNWRRCAPGRRDRCARRPPDLYQAAAPARPRARPTMTVRLRRAPVGIDQLTDVRPAYLWPEEHALGKACRPCRGALALTPHDDGWMGFCTGVNPIRSLVTGRTGRRRSPLRQSRVASSRPTILEFRHAIFTREPHRLSSASR